MGSPNIRGEFGEEIVYFEYPKVAIVEALANFLIHRDYFVDDIGRITIFPDRLEFVNPGISVISPKVLLEANEPLQPNYFRNQRLIEAMNKARLNQREGGGIIRLKEELRKNGSLINGKLGLAACRRDSDFLDKNCPTGLKRPLITA